MDNKQKIEFAASFKTSEQISPEDFAITRPTLQVDENMIEPIRIISLGLGVQSTALYYMSSIGELPRAQVAIFSDTGREKSGTMEYLEILKKWQKENNGIPIIVIQKKNLFNDLLNSVNSTSQRFSSIPAFTLNEDGSKGMLRRQCTNEYKIAQIDKAIREFLEVSNLRGQTIHVYKGISLDEMDRMSIPQEVWKIHLYPFCGYKVGKNETTRIDTKKMSRLNLIKWYSDNNLPVPPKSSCVFCPYQSDAAWRNMKNNYPDDFNDAILVDRAVRNNTNKGINSPIFLHSSCKPLEEIDFKNDAPDLWHGECLDGCHV